mgnify:CR=1 FL=1
MNALRTISLDAMGGDDAPQAVVAVAAAGRTTSVARLASVTCHDAVGC